MAQFMFQPEEAQEENKTGLIQKRIEGHAEEGSRKGDEGSARGEASLATPSSLPPASLPLRSNASIRNIEVESVEGLLTQYQEETERGRRAGRKAVRFGVIGLAAATLLEALCLLAVYLIGFEALPLAVIVGVWLVYLATLGGMARPVMRARQARLALRARLARHEDIRVLGPLAEMLTTTDPALRRTVGAALCCLLPHLNAGNAPRLTLEQRENLYAVLRGPATRDEIDLQVALLRALPCFGDSSILSTVERLAEARATPRRRGVLTEEARKCLPALRERALQERSSSTLLRASSASTPVYQLLHPAQETPHDGEQLLRPDQMP